MESSVMSVLSQLKRDFTMSFTIFYHKKYKYNQIVLVNVHK